MGALVCNVKNVCMYTSQMMYIGGIESVIRRLVPIFAEHGINSWVACEFGHPVGIVETAYEVFESTSKDRLKQWNDFLALHRTDAVIIHHVNSKSLKEEILHLKAKGIKCISVVHESFPSAMMLTGEEGHWRKVFDIGKICDLVLTVSGLDAIWWRALKVKAIHVQNPFARPLKNIETSRRTCEDGAANLLWVGRLCEPKQPKSALAALALAAAECPGIMLTMVGGTASGNRQLLREAKKLGVADKVRLVDAKHDIEDLWRTADIHLLTSLTESFCLVIAEAKAHGIPTVMFDIPFLELTQSGEGVVKVQQGDIVGMKDAIVALANNGKRRFELGQAANKSLSAFSDQAVWESWREAFKVLAGQESLPVANDVVGQVAEQIFIGWNRYCDKNLWAVRMAENWKLLTHCSLRPIASLVMCFVNCVRAIKQYIRCARAYWNKAIKSGRD